jgi:acyl-CoA thioesterase FadM
VEAAVVETSSSDPTAFGMSMELSDGRLHSVNRFPVSFKHCANLSRTVYFSNYFDWLGALREYTLWGVRDRLEELVLSGDAGLVTNAAEMQFLGQAGPSDVIESRLWLERVLGSTKSTLDLRGEFYKLPAQGPKVRLATCRMRTTWVRVIGHGEVAPAPFPSFLNDLVEAAGATNAEGQLEKVEPPPYGMGAELLRIPSGAHVELARETFDTGLEESNLIGNLYYANYFKWQGKVRDRFFFGLAPELFRGFGAGGEPYVLNSRVEFLRDAMPFDRIVVVMSVSAVHQFGAALRFEYYATDGAGTRKLAVGEHDIAWVRRGVAVPLPQAIQTALLAVDPRSARATV